MLLISDFLWIWICGLCGLYFPLRTLFHQQWGFHQYQFLNKIDTSVHLFLFRFGVFPLHLCGVAAVSTWIKKSTEFLLVVVQRLEFLLSTKTWGNSSAVISRLAQNFSRVTGKFWQSRVRTVPQLLVRIELEKWSKKMKLLISRFSES